mgnify:CR=1 FL=1
MTTLAALLGMAALFALFGRLDGGRSGAADHCGEGGCGACTGSADCALAGRRVPTGCESAQDLEHGTAHHV